MSTGMGSRPIITSPVVLERAPVVLRKYFRISACLPKNCGQRPLYWNVLQIEPTINYLHQNQPFSGVTAGRQGAECPTPHERRTYFFFFFFFCCSLFITTENGNFFTRKKHFTPEKSGKMTLPPLKNIPLTPLQPLQLVTGWAWLSYPGRISTMFPIILLIRSPT